MKQKITFKALNNAAKNNIGCVYSCSYCALQRTLSGIDPIAYHSSKYGWDCDVYIINGYIIVTGYRYPSNNYITPISKKDCEKLEQTAKNSSSFTSRIFLQDMLDEYKKSIS